MKCRRGTLQENTAAEGENGSKSSIAGSLLTQHHINTDTFSSLSNTHTHSHTHTSQPVKHTNTYSNTHTPTKQTHTHPHHFPILKPIVFHLIVHAVLRISKADKSSIFRKKKKKKTRWCFWQEYELLTPTLFICKCLGRPNIPLNASLWITPSIAALQTQPCMLL